MPLDNNPLSDREVSHVEELWDYLEAVRAELGHKQTELQLKGRQISTATLVKHVFDQCAEKGLLANLSERIQRSWVEALVTQNGGVFAQYARYMQNFNSRPKVEEILSEVKKTPTATAEFLQKLTKDHPLVGLTAGHLYTAEDDHPERPYKNWYAENIDAAARIWMKIEALFERFKTRAVKKGCADYLVEFLDAYKNSPILALNDCVNMANYFAMLSREEDCGVLTSSAEFVLRNPGDYEIRRQQIRALQELPVYSRGNFEHLKRQLGIAVPCFLSVVDIGEFLRFFEAFWDNFLTGVEPEKEMGFRSKEGDTIYFKLKGLGYILIRPRVFNGRQARIGLLGENEHRDFNVRVDQDSSGALGVDLGHVDPQEALAYAREVGVASRTKTIDTKYSSLVDQQTGDFLPKVSRGKIFQPSIMNTFARIEDRKLSHGSKASLFLAVAMKHGQEMELREGTSFSYHYDDPKMAPHGRRFVNIALEFCKSLMY